MKKLILILLIVITVPNIAEAKSIKLEQIGSVETALFGYDYKGEDDTKRIERIESYLYGQKKTGNIQRRLTDIQNDIGYNSAVKDANNNENASNEAIGKTNTYRNDKDVNKLKEDSSVNYPIVDKMEQEIFKTTYKTEDIYNRLNRLEEKVFTRTSDAPLSDRVDKLSSVIMPKKSFKNSLPKFNYTSDELEEYYSNSGLDPINDNSLPFQLSALEEDLLKNNFESDNIANRLTRLEKKLFKKTFENDSDISRLQRIMVAYDAKKNSFKYDNNRTMQNMATISQVGGILLMILAILL